MNLNQNSLRNQNNKYVQIHLIEFYYNIDQVFCDTNQRVYHRFNKFKLKCTTTFKYHINSNVCQLIELINDYWLHAAFDRHYLSTRPFAHDDPSNYLQLIHSDTIVLDRDVMRLDLVLFTCTGAMLQDLLEILLVHLVHGRLQVVLEALSTHKQSDILNTG